MVCVRDAFWVWSRKRKTIDHEGNEKENAGCDFDGFIWGVFTRLFGLYQLRLLNLHSKSIINVNYSSYEMQLVRRRGVLNNNYLVAVRMNFSNIYKEQPPITYHFPS